MIGSKSALSDVRASLNNSDSAISNEYLQELMKQSFIGSNFGIIYNELCDFMFSVDSNGQKRILNVLSLYNSLDISNSNVINIYLKRFLIEGQNTEHVLKCCLNVLTYDLYEHIKVYVDKFAAEGSEVSRKLCLCIYKKAVSYSSCNLGVLMAWVKRAMFDKAMKLQAISVLAEICMDNPSVGNPFVPFLLGEINSSSMLLFSKICKILGFVISESSEYADLIHDKVSLFIDSHQQLFYMIEAGILASKLDQKYPLIQEIGKKLEGFILTSKQPSHHYIICDVLNRMSGKYNLSSETLSYILSLRDPSIISLLLKMHGISNQTSVEIKTGINTLISDGIKNPFSSMSTMASLPATGPVYVSLIFSIYSTKNQTLLKSIVRLLDAITDEDTMRLVIIEAKQQMPELPDDSFGISIGHIISNISKDSEDFFILLPSNIAYRSEEFQSEMLGCAYVFWSRLQFEITVSIKNRLLLLNFSPFREVRQRSVELLEFSCINK